MNAAPQRIHLGYLDGVRGWAAVFVVLHHMWQFVAAGPDFRPLPPWFEAATILRFGAFAVAVFIVLSGYCLMLPVVQTPGIAFQRGVFDFIVRRSKRILPPYFAALLLSIGLASTPWLNRETGTQWDICLPALTPGSLLSHAVLAHNLVLQLRWKLNPPMWTVALEWQIYFVFALVLLGVWRRFGPPLTVLAGFALGVIPVLLGAGYIETWLLGGFALGMFAAGANFRPSAWMQRWIDAGMWHKLSIVGAVAVALVMVSHRWVETPALASDTLVALTATASFITATNRLQRNELLPLAIRPFAHSSSIRLGHFSYSLYLIHYPLVATLYLFLRPLHLTPTADFAALVCCGLPAILCTAYGFHRMFERPFMDRKRIAADAAGGLRRLA